MVASQFSVPDQVCVWRSSAVPCIGAVMGHVERLADRTWPFANRFIVTLR